MLAVTYEEIQGVRCAVHDTGPPGSAEAIVFVHGNPGPMDDWEPLVPDAARLGRVIAMDMPGYGRADHPRDFDFTVDGYARFLGTLLERLGVRRAHLVLHDFGGPWGIKWATDHPGSLASLTLVNTGVLMGYRWHKYARGWQTPILGEVLQLLANKPLLALSLRRDNPRPVPPRFVDQVMRYADWGHKRAVLALYRASKDTDAAFGAIADRLKLLDGPTCVIWGERDPYLPVEYAFKQKTYFPKARVRVLPGLGHWPFMDDAEAVREPLVSFLKEHVGKG